MVTICIQYSGLKFNHIFETESFVFIPEIKYKLAENKFLDLMELFSCEYDKNSKFYVLLKDSIEQEITLENFKEEKFHKFRILEAIISLIFSNHLRREFICMLDKDNSGSVVTSVFKSLLNNFPKVNRTLVWKNLIYTKFLRELVGKAFEKYDLVASKEDFATRFAFSVDSYLRGKFGEGELRTNSDLWIGLEILSEITISLVLHKHGRFEVKKFYKCLQKIVHKRSSKIPLDKVDCWPPMKEDFPDHMANKINPHLPILKKCLKLTGELKLDVENIKVPLRKKTDKEDSARYQEYLDKIKDFKEYQDNLSIKKVLKAVYKKRNALFHEGKVSETWTLKSDRVKANFIKILEQLFFKVLGLDTIMFYQMGYPYQYIFGILINEEEFENIGSISKLERDYVHQSYVEPLHPEYKNPFDYQPVREEYLTKSNEFDPLRDLLNSTLEKIITFLKHTHPTQILVNGQSFDYNLDYQILNRKKVLFAGLSPRLDPIVADRKPHIVVKNQNDSIISSVFVGMFEDDVRHGMGTITVPFRITPPYIYFKLF